LRRCPFNHHSSVSAAAAVVTDQPQGFFFFALLIALYMILYLVFIIFFGQQLALWDETTSGRCYNASIISDRISEHPLVDNIYLSITAFYFFGSLLMCIPLGHLTTRLFSRQSKGSTPTVTAKSRTWAILSRIAAHNHETYLLFSGNHEGVLSLAFVQYPLHCYMIYALRASNEQFLTGGSENEWGFGQIVALILVVSTILDMMKAVAGKLNAHFV
jgi:hypothetical protein